jgi:cytochrome c556
MRPVLLAAASTLMLVACGGPETSQANNAQANISTDSRTAATATASVVTPVATSPVSGDEAKRVMHERHEGMEAIGKASKAIRDQLQGDSPDLGVIRANAARIADLSQKATGWFHAGTGPEAGKTGAKPEIWQNPQDFAAKLSAFQAAAGKLQTAANSGDLGAVKASLGPLGESCKACHDKYRSKMHH